MSLDALEQRFWAKVDRRKPYECWQWLASAKPNGYGQFGVTTGVVRYAHRVAYELTHGPIPTGLEVDHLCHNLDRACSAPCSHRRCVNPAHLDLVTHAQNCRRAGERVTHCPRGHPYEGENLIDRRDVKLTGGRECRACRRERKLP